MKYVLPILACVVLAGFAPLGSDGQSAPPGSTKPATAEATPTGQTYDTFSVLAVGKAGTPRLTPLQMEWLNLIHSDPTYRPRWSHLRWTIGVQEEHLPVVVFDDDSDVRPEAGASLDYGEFLIIGDVCNAAFKPSEHSIMSLPHFDIPCKPSEQLRVRGERELLGWEP